ncbi:MAG: M55 family metallopeptidase [Armatimonadota bacterium]
MKVYVSTDMEGCSGIATFAQCGRDPELYEKEGRPLLMGDVNALVEGLLAGGADDIVVSDGHAGGCNFIPEMMHPGARYYTGVERPRPAGGADERFDCAVLLGYHAMNGTERGMMHHTQSSRAESRYWYNGVESGEIVQSSLVLGHFGIPVVMVTGDEATCDEAHRFLGDTIVTVAVKEGWSRQSGVLIAPEKAHEMIAEGAKKALQQVEKCEPFRLDLPIEGKMVIQTPEYAEKRGSQLGEKINDNTWVATFESPLDIYKF